MKNCSYCKSVLKMKSLPQSKKAIEPPQSPRGSLTGSETPHSNNIVKPTYEAETNDNSMKSSTGYNPSSFIYFVLTLSRLRLLFRQFIGAQSDLLLDKVIEGSLDVLVFIRTFPLFIDPLSLFYKVHSRYIPVDLIRLKPLSSVIEFAFRFLFPKNEFYREYLIDFLERWQHVLMKSLHAPSISN